MAFRRFSRFRSRGRFGSRPRRPSLNWQKSQKPKRWLVGNFNLQHIYTLNAGSAEQEYVASFVASPAFFTDGLTASARVLNENIRRLEIGGIVWTAFFDRISADIATVPPFVPDWLLQMVWTINDLDNNGAPIGVDFPWGTNTAPVSTGGSALTENIDEPVRILDRTADRSWFYSSTLPAGHFTSSQFQQSRRQRSLRLKVPLRQNQALVFTSHITNFNQLVSDDSVDFRCLAVGTIYYRYVM